MSEVVQVWVRRCWLTAFALAASSCGQQGAGTDTRTNWLTACDQAAQCGSEFACLCGVCTLACENAATCDGLGKGAACLAVDGCGRASNVCSTVVFEAARGERQRDAGGDAIDTMPANTVEHTSAVDAAREDTAVTDVSAANATFVPEESPPTYVVEPDETLTTGEPSDGNTGCSPRAADAGLCGEVDACQAGDVLPTTEPCEVTGFVTRECVQGQWADACISCKRVAFADPALEQAVRDALEKPSGELTLTDAASLTALNAGSYGIYDLRGIECFTGLSFLNLEQNQLSELSPLGQLPALTSLGLSRNQVTDITPLASVSTLEDLWIANNTVADLTPLSKLTNLWGLGLSSNAISNLEPLRELTALTALDVSNNPFTNIEPLSSLTALIDLTLGPNPAFEGDLSPTIALTALGTLMLPDCGLDDGDLASLVGQTQLDTLDLTSNQIVDVSELSAFSNTSLLLNYNPLECDSASLAALETQNFMTYTDCP
jgi:internalin A